MQSICNLYVINMQSICNLYGIYMQSKCKFKTIWMEFRYNIHGIKMKMKIKFKYNSDAIQMPDKIWMQSRCNLHGIKMQLWCHLDENTSLAALGALAPRSLPGTPHCLQNPKWPLGGTKRADGVWKALLLWEQVATEDTKNREKSGH